MFGDIEDGEGAGAGSEGDAGAGGEDDNDDNGPGAANDEEDAGEASGADSATTQDAKKAAAVSGPLLCLALSVYGPVRRTPSPGCPMAPVHCMQNNKHLAIQNLCAAAFQAHFCRGPRAAEFKRHVIYLSYVRYMFSFRTCHMSGIYLVYIISGNMTYT